MMGCWLPKGSLVDALLSRPRRFWVDSAPATRLMIRALFTVRLLDGVLPGSSVVPQPSLGIMFGRGRTVRRGRDILPHEFLGTGLGLVALWSGGWTTLMLLGHCALLQV